MIWRSDPARRHDPLGTLESGFTLIELMVVIAVLGLTLVLIGLNARPVSPATHARAATEEISGALRAARSLALMSNRSVAFTLDIASPAYQWDNGQRHPLPSDIELSLLTGSGQLASATQGSIRFDPDGGSSGGRVTINGGGHRWWVGVDWLSGRVSIVQNPD